MTSPNSKRLKLEVSSKYVYEIYKNPTIKVGNINITAIEGFIKLQGKVIGTVDSHLISRGEGFYFACDTISEEIQKCAVFFFDSEGKIKDDHYIRSKASDSCNTGGYLHIGQIKINEVRYRGKELGYNLLHKLLQRLSGQWSVCFSLPTPYNALLDDPKYGELTYTDKLVAISQCYARLGFQQCSLNEASSQAAYWFLDATTYTGDNIMTKAESQLVHVVIEIQEEKLNESNEQISEIIASFRNLNPTRAEIAACKTKIQIILAGGSANLNTGHALHYAMANLGFALIIPLVELGANINGVDEHGDTPLHVAANLGLTPAIPILLAQGADKTITNKEGHTALTLAQNMVQASAVHKESQGGVKQIYNDEVGVQAQICVDYLI